MVDLLDGIVEVLLNVNSKFVAIFMKDMKVVPVDDHHLRLYSRGYLLGLSTPFRLCLLVIAMNILTKRSRQSVFEGGHLQQSYIPSLTRTYVTDVSRFFFINLLMFAPISKMMVLSMDLEKGDSGDGLFQGLITQGCLFGSISMLFCLLGMALINRRQKMRMSEEMEILRKQNLLVRSRLQMEVQRYLDETRHQARSPFADLRWVD